MISYSKADFIEGAINALNIFQDKNDAQASINFRANCAEYYKKRVIDTNDFDLKHLWSLVYEAIIKTPSENLISTIGSQGFLSVPICRIEKLPDSFYFLRLHIWHNDFKKYFDEDKFENFAIHSHQFHANSLILAGEVFNTRVLVTESELEKNSSLFKIDWEKDPKNINQKTSVAINTERGITNVPQIKESYKQGDSYEITAGEYHLSRTNPDKEISATLFLFSSEKSYTGKSNVVGPSSVKKSTINRKHVIDCMPYIEQLNNLINE